jgi:hypothetical protein
LFREENHFDWGVSLKQDIYLKLWLVGRASPVWLWITGPEKVSDIAHKPGTADGALIRSVTLACSNPCA